jgi:type IV secretory pathway VirB10-like protein
MNENERLREVLRHGDPGGGEAGLTTEESQAMRRTVLSAVPESRERFRLAPVFFTAAAAILSCVVGLSLWRTHSQPDQPARTVQTAQPTVPAPQAAPPIQPQPESPVAVAVVSPPPRTRLMRPTRPMRSRPVEEAKLEEIPETTTRQVQFSAPGGTRIIWLLTNPSAD